MFLWSITRKVYAPFAGASIIFVLYIFPNWANAIPESQALKKLQVVPVFVVTDSNGVPLPIPRERELVLPLYLERSKADEQLDVLRRSNPALGAGVVALPLDVMNAKVVELNQKLTDKSKRLVAPIIGNDNDLSVAKSLLRQQGLTEQKIKESLNVPVFFTKPFLTIKTPDGPRGVFFLSYENLQNALAQIPVAERQKLKPQVADLTAVLREIINAPNDNYTIFPTPEYFRLVKENKNSSLKLSDSSIKGADLSSITPNPSVSETEQAPQLKKPAISPASVAALAQQITVRIEGPGPSGSGTVAYRSGDKYTILTAWHVVSNVAEGESIRLIFANGRSLMVPRASLVRIGLTDLASMKVVLPFNLDLAPLLQNSKAQPGEKITVSGWSLATKDNPVLYRYLPGTIISVAPSPTNDGYAILYTMASPTLEGMSGGPVMRDDGTLVGIHGKAERLPSANIEGVKDIATTNGQAMPLSIFTAGD